MSEASDMVSGVSELPLFPLSVVLFPGVPLPLHIFEPRYRQMLRDIQTGNSLFGLSYFDASTSERDLPAVGSVGCVAKVTESQPYQDGRSNILTVGVIRYRIEGYVERGDPYLVVRVSYFEDEDENSEAVKRVRAKLRRLLHASPARCASSTTNAHISQTLPILSRNDSRFSWRPPWKWIQR